MARHLLWALVLATGCVSKTAVVQAPESHPVAMAMVLSAAESGEAQGAPESVADRIAEVVVAHGLTVAEVPAEEGGLLDKSTTATRLAWVTDNAQGAPALLLVEAEARWFSQLSGRYRWTVDVVATIAPVDDTQAGLTLQFTVPVHLLFDHQREPEALQEAAPVISRRISGLLDTWLAEKAE